MTDSFTPIRQALVDIDFPATKQDIVAHAEQAGTDREVIRVLRGLPLATYLNMSEVRRSVRINPADDEGHSASDKVAHSRSKHSHQVAEYLREVD
ncbi:MAG: DUF2795 domain-containing protein [Hamadaea sp.]|nr:DUF2795 domain-containing protein [Hamadaea sp.]